MSMYVYVRDNNRQKINALMLLLLAGNCQNFSLRIAYNTVFCRTNGLKVKVEVIVVFLIACSVVVRVSGEKAIAHAYGDSTEASSTLHSHLDHEIKNYKRKMNQHKAS